MPIQRTFTPRSITQAAQAEGLTLQRVQTLFQALGPSAVRGLVVYATTEADNADLAMWKAKFPTLLTGMTDEEASALIRIAVTLAGGVVV